eukprot:scaffold424_cov162-Amphora_coffeaeformis.AAC.5
MIFLHKEEGKDDGNGTGWQSEEGQPVSVCVCVCVVEDPRGVTLLFGNPTRERGSARREEGGRIGINNYL